jgi:hypothetical protein
VDPLGIIFGAPAEDIDEGPGLRRCGSAGADGLARLGKRLWGGGLRCQDRPGEIAGGNCLCHDPVGQAGAEPLFEAEEQLDPLQAPDPEVAVEGVVEGDALAGPRPSHFGDEPLDDVEDPYLNRLIRTGPAG